jgi:hypothetical protein
MKKFFQEMKIRFALPSPVFFQQLAKFGTWLIGLGMIILTPDIPSEMGIDLNIPQIFPAVITKIAGYLVVAGILVNRVSRLTVQDNSQLPNQP